MAAAAPDPSKCSDGACSCRRTQKTLDAAKKQRLEAYKEKNAELPPKAKLHEAFPDDGVADVYYDGAHPWGWCCAATLCGHPIALHPEGSPPRDDADLRRIARQEAEAVAGELTGSRPSSSDGSTDAPMRGTDFVLHRHTCCICHERKSGVVRRLSTMCPASPPHPDWICTGCCQAMIVTSALCGSSLLCPLCRANLTMPT